MSKNYLRYFKLTVESGDQSWEFSSLRVKWKVSNVTQQTPGLLEARIYNVAPKTRQALLKTRFAKVTVEAGYRENHGVLFSGQCRQVRDGHETPTETFLDIFAQQADKAINTATTNKTWPAGTTHKQIFDDAFKDLQKADPNVKLGYIGPDLSQIKYPKAFTFYGMTAQLMRMIAKTNNATWHIGHDYSMNMIKNDRKDGLPGEPIPVNSATGMIGSPVQTQEGILVRSLINPEFAVGKKIRIKQSSIQLAQWDLSFGPRGIGENQTEQPAVLPELSPDGTYRILAIDWHGDTRGTPWYAELYTYYGHIPEGAKRFESGGEGPP